jgi:ATP-binding cassette subfamily B protein
MKFSVKIRQQDLSDCGVASLASVAAFYGLRFPVAKLRNYSGTNSEGSTIAGLIDAAKKIGLTAKGYKGKLSSLYKIPKPAILHLKKKSGLLHFAVLYRIGKKVAHIMDPSEGRILRIKIEDLCQEWTGHIIVALPDDYFSKGRVGVAPLQRLWKIFKTKKRDYLKALTVSLLFILISISTSFFIKYLIDDVIPSGDRHQITLTGIAMICFAALSFFLFWHRSKILLNLSVGTNHELISSFVTKLFELPQQYFDSRKTGEITSRIDDAFKVGNMLSEAVLSFIINILTFLLSIIVLLNVQWKLSLLLLAFLPLYILLYITYDIINRSIRKIIMENGAKFESSLIENIRSSLTVKCFGIEKEIVVDIRDRLVTLNSSIVKAGKWGIAFAGSTDFNSKLLSLITLWAGGLFILAGKLTLGELILFYTLTALFSSPLNSFIALNTSIRDGMAAAERLFEVMDLDVEPYNEGLSVDLDIEELKMEKIVFGYAGRDKVLQDFNLCLKSGQITALCGESGSGKSTVALLLMRMLRAESGAITANEVDINQINLQLWRNMITIVPQNPGLFSGTVSQNIAPGETEPDCELILQLCRELGLLDLLKRLPLGLDTFLGENGSRLSRGEQQRIAVARALYREPKILILDEATSSCDNESKNLILNSVVRQKERGCIILLISHHKEDIAIADRLINMK